METKRLHSSRLRTISDMRQQRSYIGRWQTAQYYSAEIRLSSRLPGTLSLRRSHQATSSADAHHFAGKLGCYCRA